MRLYFTCDSVFSPRIAENGVQARFEQYKIKSTDQIKTDEKFLLVSDYLFNGEVIRKFKSGVIIFDAHASLLPGIHDAFVRRLTEIIPSSQIILVGVREFSLADHAILRQLNVKFFPMSGIHESISSACDALMELAKNWKFCHVLISLDVLDPVFAQVQKPSSGGMSSRDLIYFCQRLTYLRNFHSASIIGAESNIPLAEKLLTELAVERTH